MELGSNYDLDVKLIRNHNDNVLDYIHGWNTLYTDSGRSAIRFFASEKSGGKVLLPEYICKSVIDCFENNYEIEYYRLNERLEINQEDLEGRLDKSVRIVYIMHYFGWLQKEDILNYIKDKKKEYKFVIVEDTTHCFLTSLGTVGDYQICSLRKWFPIPDGGVLYSGKSELTTPHTAKTHDSAMVTEAMILKHMYLNNGIDCNAIYRSMFEAYENILDTKREISMLSRMSSVLLQCIDINEVATKRKKNWNYLYRALKNEGFNLLYDEKADSFVPFSFPILVEDRDSFRRILMDNKIYCAVHWPIETEVQRKMKTSSYISEHIISLPIDQRYGEREMEYMLKIIRQYCV